MLAAMLPRRKALLGYLTWMVASRVAKRMVKRRARGAAVAVTGGTARGAAVRLPLIGAAVAAAAGLAVAVRRRRSRAAE
jgi:hypothetical protein